MMAIHISLLVRLLVGSGRGSHPVSRFLRRLFEDRRAGKILGTNLAFVSLLTSLLGNPLSAFGNTPLEETSFFVTQTPTLTTQTSLQAPVENYRISQGFHLFHLGVDLDQEEGVLVRPILPGRVSMVEYSNYSFGNSVLVEHESGFASRYAHLGQILVAVGETVGQETILGTVGHTGRATGSHLHLEIYQEGVPINPAPLLPKEEETFLASLKAN